MENVVNTGTDAGYIHLGSTNKIRNILQGANLKVSGIQKTNDGGNRMLVGALALTSLGLHMITLHPQITLLSIFAHAAIGGLATYITVDGAFKTVDGYEEAALGQEITERALETPDFTGSSNILLFRPVTPEVDSASVSPAPALRSSGN